MSAPEEMTLKVIAHIRTAFPTKFGIPRQSGLVDSLRGEVIFTPEYRNADAVRGLEDFSHIWLVWQFSGAVRDSWSPTVRPPRLGGNTRMGVFATRSPFRPNPLGLSSVQLEAIEHRPDVGPVLIVRGADLMDGTPIYDIKPYIPYADCHPDAAAGFTAQTQFHHLTMVCDAALWARVPADQQAALQGVLENDPRPSYQHDPERVYGMEFGGLEVHFKVDGEVLTVIRSRDFGTGSAAPSSVNSGSMPPFTVSVNVWVLPPYSTVNSSAPPDISDFAQNRYALPLLSVTAEVPIPETFAPETAAPEPSLTVTAARYSIPVRQVSRYPAQSAP